MPSDVCIRQFHVGELEAKAKLYVHVK